MIKKIVINLFAIVVLNFGMGTMVASAIAPPVPQDGYLAQSFSQLADILQEIKDALDKFYKGFAEYYGIETENYTAPTISKTPDFDALKINNDTVRKQSSTLALGRNLTAQTLVNLLTTPPDKRLCRDCAEENIKTADQLISNYASLFTFPYTRRTTAVLDSEALKEIRKDFKEGKLKSVHQMSLDSLLGPRGFSLRRAEEGELTPVIIADNFIKFSAGLSELFLLDNRLPPNRLNEEGKNQREVFLVGLLARAAKQSVGLSNLNQMFARRIRNARTGKSPLEHEHEMVTRRLKEKWHDDMEKATPLTLQREMLYLLAEINYQLYQQRRDNERLLATVSAMQLEQLDVQKILD